MIPRTFHWIWLGADGPPAEAERLRDGWLERHPDWEWRLWGDDDVHWLEHRALYERSASFAQRADIARYEILRRYGGVFIDADMECLRRIDPLLTDEVEFFAGRQGGGLGLIANGFVGSVPGHPLLQQVMSMLPVTSMGFRREGIYMQTGPGLLTAAIRRFGWEQADGVRIFPPEFFFPYFMDEPWRAEDEFPRAYAVHRWNHSWREERGVAPSLLDVVPRGWSDAGAKAQAARYVARARASRLVKAQLARAVRFAQRQAGEPHAPRTTPHGIPWGPDRILVAGPLGTRLLVSRHDLSLAPSLALDGTYDAEFVAFLERSLHPGMTFVDVGANVGFFALIAATLVGRGGRVVAYECDPELVALLTENVQMNWFADRIDVVPAAAGRESGTVRFWRSKGLTMLGSTTIAPDTRSLLDDTEELQVPSEPLDLRLADGRFVDLLKIDVEGAEAAVLDGAQELLARRAVGMVSVEYRDDALTARAGREMADALTGLERTWGATFHVPGRPASIPLDEVLARCDFQQLLIRFPGSRIDPS